MSEMFPADHHDDDIWDRLQWRVHDLLLREHDPLVREALYRRGELCIRDCGQVDDRCRRMRLRQFRLAYLLSADRGGLALS